MKISSVMLKNSFENYMETLFPASGEVAIGVAVSGGKDSMALLYLAYQWFINNRKGVMHAFTVDHGLRAESKEEALWVHNFLKRHNIPHSILHAVHDFPLCPQDKSYQAEARQMRYNLLFEACHTYTLSHVLLGHHKQDQAETFFDHLFRGSGIEGLSGMPMLRKEKNITLVRPLLPYSSHVLETILSENGWEYVSDPSNENMLYQRVRIRKWLSQENPARISPDLLVDRMAKTADHMQRAKECLDFYVEKEMQEKGFLSLLGYSWLDWSKVKRLPKEIIVRLLMYNISYVKGKKEFFRFENIDRLCHKIAEDNFKAATLHGCYIRKKEDFLFFYREKSKITVSEKVNFNESLLWDGRFSIILNSKAITSCRVTSFDDRCRQRLITQKKLPLEIPKDALYGLPVFYQEDKLMAIPHLFFYEEEEQWKEAIEIIYNLHE